MQIFTIIFIMKMKIEHSYGTSTANRELRDSTHDQRVTFILNQKLIILVQFILLINVINHTGICDTSKIFFVAGTVN